MRIALIGDFDTYLTRGLERPADRMPIRCAPGLNLLRGFRELGIRDIHTVVVTDEVNSVTVVDGPFGVVHLLPRPRLSGSACFYLWRRAMILAELAKIKPDVVHGQGTEMEYGFTAVTSPYPNCVTVHGILHRVHKVVPPPLLSTAFVPRWLEKLVARRATDVICISRAVEEFLEERRSPARRHRIPNAAAPVFVESRATAGSGNRLLFVGSIYPLKGLLPVVEALARLPKITRLQVIGSAGGARENIEYETGVRQRARELGVSDQIEWSGVLGEREVARAMAGSDALVLASFQESAPMCIAEAMSVGLPVVATRVGGIPDMVEHGVTGLLVPPGAVDELASALGTVLRDATMRQRFGAAGRVAALARYAPRAVAERTFAVYRSLAA